MIDFIRDYEHKIISSQSPVSTKSTACTSGIPVHAEREAVISTLSSYQHPRLLRGLRVSHIYQTFHYTVRYDGHHVSGLSLRFAHVYWFLLPSCAYEVLKCHHCRLRTLALSFHTSDVTAGLMSAFCLWVKVLRMCLILLPDSPKTQILLSEIRQ